MDSSLGSRIRPIVGPIVVSVLLMVSVAVASTSDSGPKATASATVAKQIKKLQRQIDQLKSQVGQPGPPGPQGSTGAPGPSARWALVDNDGDIAASSGGITEVTIPGQLASQYFIDFGTDVTNRPILVSQSYQLGATGAPDALKASPCGGADVTPGSTICPLTGGDNDHTVFVLVSANGMHAANGDGFYIVLLP
jgi:hypothetical protein